MYKARALAQDWRSRQEGGGKTLEQLRLMLCRHSRCCCTATHVMVQSEAAECVKRASLGWTCLTQHQCNHLGSV